jgi:hypothetical protein
MLHECGVNAVIPLINANTLWKAENTRRGFLKDLGLELVGPHTCEGPAIPKLPRNLKMMVMKLCKIEYFPSRYMPSSSKRICSYCSW